jgi:hypothetical protein
MESVLLWIATIAAVLGVVLSVPPFLRSFRRPRLELRPRGIARVDRFNPEDDSHTVVFELELRNSGRGWGRNWRVKLKSERRIDVRRTGARPSGWSVHTGKSGRYIAEWWAVEEGDAVPPRNRLDHPLPTEVIAVVPGNSGTLEADYLLLAEDFGPHEGRFRVSVGEKDPRVELTFLS